MARLYQFRYVIFLVCLSILLWGIFRPESPPQPFDNADKIWHTLAFFGFSLTARFAFCHKAIWLVWIVLALSAPTLEYLQGLLQTSRQFSYGDMLGNLSGVVLAFTVWKLLLKTNFNENIRN